MAFIISYFKKNLEVIVLILLYISYTLFFDMFPQNDISLYKEFSLSIVFDILMILLILFFMIKKIKYIKENKAMLYTNFKFSKETKISSEI